MQELIFSINTEISKEKFLALIFSSSRTESVSFLNAHAVNLCYKDQKFKHAVLSSDYILRDGIGVKIACLLHKIDPGNNMNGTDLIPEIIKQAKIKQSPIYYFGSNTLNINTLKTKLNDEINSYFLDGFRDFNEYIHLIKDTIGENRGVVILGMGMPKQELFAKYIKERFNNVNVVIVCGGAIINRLAGLESRAPLFLRSFGLEWLYRLSKEPKRLFGRYVLGNHLFLYRTILSSTKDLFRKN